MSTEFSTEQFAKAYSEGIETSYWHIARKKTVLRYLRKYQLNNILDVGCGSGIITSYMHKAGLKVTGVELGSPPPNKKTDVVIYYDTNAINLPESLRNIINTVTLFDVIEHIEDPVSFLKSLSSKYPNLKNLVITVPARKELWTNFDDYYGHFRRYTLKDIKKEMEASGFEIVFSRYFFHILYFLIRMNNLIVKKREVSFNPPTGALMLLMNKLLGGLFYLELFLIPGKFVGSSIICICKKNS